MSKFFDEAAISADFEKYELEQFKALLFGVSHLPVTFEELHRECDDIVRVRREVTEQVRECPEMVREF